MNERVLFIGFKRQKEALNGGEMANRRSLQTLRKKFGDDAVDTYYILDEDEHRGTIDKLRAVFYFFCDIHNGLTPKKIKEITEKANAYDYVFISTSVLGILAKKLKEAGYKGSTIVHYHNVEEIYYDALIPKWVPGRNVVIRCAAHNDEYACKYADKIITLSQRDSNYLAKHYGRQADAIIGITLQDKLASVPDISALTSSVPKCLFLGSYFTANNEGILWFVKNVLPHVHVELKIIGKDMHKLKEANKCLSDIEVLSNVPDLTPYLTDADFMILPIFAGSGMKVKTCESLMYGKNILGTDETFEGYDLDADKTGRRCNTAEEYIAALNYFSAHPVKRFNDYSRKTFLEKYSESATEKTFCSVF